MVRLTSQHLNTMLGAILNCKTTNRKHKNAKTMALNRQQKGHLFNYKNWNKKAEHLSTSAGKVHIQQLKLFASMHTSKNDCSSIMSVILEYKF